ncbi:hypothetical protein HJC23_003615 [Cyclotella cryptica]|uniref:Prolyl endopeptidase-like n=1 Tax=Cyclotella cryptica TaxID=29204 RepID=A0ABD3QIP3_9STRA|eukprot:CCRYP_004892-RA/>CCRYP_004892-RA protein AED:0.05 eAED:0.05 QI:0/-1/0/1/-1/1/1/0/913
MDFLRHLRVLPTASILIWLTAAAISVAWSPRQLAFLHPSHRRLPKCVHLSPSLSCPLGDASRQSIAHHCRFLPSLTPHLSSQNSAESNDNVPQPPVAFRNESSFLLAGDLGIHTHGPPRQSPSSPHPLLSPPRSIPDPYAWLRDDARTNTTVLSHLHAENEYTRLMTQHLHSIRETLYQELLSGMHETDCTTPMADGTYWYYARYEEGVSYPRYCRAPRKMEDLYPPAVVAVGNDPEVPSLLLLPGEEVYLDVPRIAQKENYLAVGAISVSPNQEYVAYSVDATGGEICQFHVKHIASGKEWVLYEQDGDDGNEKTMLEGYGAIVWDEQSMGIFYVTMDETHRPYRVYYRRLFRFDGSYINESERPMDELLLEEDDKLFSVHIEKTLDGKYLLISCSSSESSEVHYLDLNSRITDGPMASNLVCIAQRRNKVLYRVAHCKGYWLVQTNLGGLPNFSLKACPVGEEFNGDKWKDLVLLSTGNAVFDGGHEKSLDGVRVYDPPPENSHGLSSPFAFCVATGREDGLPRVWILELDKDEQVGSGSESNSLVVTKITRLEFTETPFHASVGDNRDPTLPYVVVEYDSLVTPLSHIAVPLSNPMELDARKVLKEKEVPGYEKDLYSCERTTVKSRDGQTEIPISVVFRRDAVSRQTGNKGGVPTHLYGYGSYGSSIEASFRATRLPLLNRGVVFVIAHVRGGGEMGRPWYEHAKYLSKMNSFNDFVDVARWLTGDNVESSGVASASDSGYDTDWCGITSASKLSCEGRSAGGLLIGAAINQAPHLFRAAILGVPFVDVLCTMVDSTLPLTIAEWEEWGNPNEERYFQYIEGYSPINNVRHGEMYPACLLTGGLYDPRVQYWEPAKFAAELRHGVSKDSGKVLLKIDMDAGHSSGHDRYKYLRELSFDYAFLLDKLGLV